MNTLRSLYHMALADFRERTRRYSFLIMLGLVMWIGYLSASGQMRMRVPPDHIGMVIYTGLLYGFGLAKPARKS